MLSAQRKLTGEVITAYFSTKAHGPFACIDCGDEVVLRAGRKAASHFAHANPLACRYATGESAAHRRCKIEVFLALKKSPNASDVFLEQPMGTNRPDVFARICGIPVAIEVQISSLSVETIMQRTIDYYRQGVYVLWLLPWTPALDGQRYAPKAWERWIHAAYFGRVYYWLEGLTVASYRFEPHLKSVPRRTWHSEGGRRMASGGYSVRSKRHRTAVREGTLDIATDFVPKDRTWWESSGIKVPDAKLFTRRERF